MEVILRVDFVTVVVVSVLHGWLLVGEEAVGAVDDVGRAVLRGTVARQGVVIGVGRVLLLHGRRTVS